MKHRYEQRSKGSGLLKFFLAILGLAVGLYGSLYAWLAKTHYTPIAVVSDVGDVVAEDMSLYTEIQSGSHVPVYVDPDFPIQKVPKKDLRVDNYLIVGTDSRGEEVARTDSMIILSVDRRHRVIKLSSLMRDIEVDLPGREGMGDKLNAAYAFGGIGLLINTVNESFDLDIQQFMLLDFWSAVDVVDTMGGVNIDIRDDEVWAVNDVVYEMNSLMGNPAEANLLSGGGNQTLNGTQAIAWARVRAVDSDHERTGRQRVLIGAILQKFSSLNPLDQMETATAVLEQMGTNMRPNNLLSLGFSSILGTKELMDYKVPADESMYTTDGSNWNILLDWDAQVPALHDFIYQAAP